MDGLHDCAGIVDCANAVLLKPVVAAAAKSFLHDLKPGRALGHNFAHLSPPSSPPSPPAPPAPPPMPPPPPPITSAGMIPMGPALAVVVGVMCCCCLVFGLKALRDKKKGKGKDGDGKDDGGGGDAPTPRHGPKKFRRRGCTDVLCLLLFCGFWLGMVYLFYLGLTVGDPYSVLYGKDYLGNRCGRGNMTSKPKVIYPRIDQDVMEQMAIATTAPWKLEFYGICVETCPNVQDPTICFTTPDDCMVNDYGTEDEWRPAGGSAYYFTVMPTISVVNRCIPIANTRAAAEPQRCAWPQCDNITNPWMVCDGTFPSLWIPQNSAEQGRCEIKYQNERVARLNTQNPSPLVERLADKMAAAQRIIQSVMDAQDVIIILGVAAPIVLGFAWLIVLRFFAKTVIYCALIGIGVGLFGVTGYLFITTGLLQQIVGDILASNATQALLASAVSVAADVQSQAASAGLVDANSTIDLSGGGNGSLADQANAAIADANNMVMTLIPEDMAADAAASQQSNPLLWQIAAWAMLAISCIYFILMILWRKKIALCAALVKEASVVIKDRPLHITFPFFALTATVILVVFFVLGMLFLATADIQPSHFSGSAMLTSSATFAQIRAALNDTISAATAGGSSDADAVMAAVPSGIFTLKNGVYTYFLFGFLWTNAFINAFAWTSLSGSYSHWYFFRRDENYKTRIPLVWSVLRVIRYHLGSLAVGSFLIAVVQLLRIMAEIIDRQTKGIQGQNKMMMYAMKCVKCGLMLLEKTVKFITNYCYIYVAMQGSGFCWSCWCTFKLIMGQMAQLAINTLVRTVLNLATLVSIPLACYQATDIVLTSRGAFEPFYPAVVVALLALVITNVFGLVFACVLDTLFVCTVRDKAEYKAAFMSDRLYTAYGFDPKEREKKDDDGGGKDDKKGGKEEKGEEKPETTQSL